MLNGTGKIAEVAVEPGSASTMAREKGFEDAIASKFPAIKIVDKQYGMADFAQSLNVSENMLTAAPDLAGMFASNESSTVQILEGLRNGVVDSIVVQDPFQMGYRSFVAAATRLKGAELRSASKPLSPRSSPDKTSISPTFSIESTRIWTSI